MTTIKYDSVEEMALAPLARRRLGVVQLREGRPEALVQAKLLQISSTGLLITMRRVMRRAMRTKRRMRRYTSYLRSLASKPHGC